MKKMFAVILAGLFLTSVLGLGFYVWFIYSVKAMHKKQTVAENIQVTSDWLEVSLEKPLKTTKQVQKVMLSIEGYKSDYRNNDFGNIKLADGTSINPEIQVVDESDKIYELRDGTRTGNDVGFYPNKEIHGTHSFPNDVTYKTIKIRSDKPFLCKRIYWYDYDLK